MHLHKARFYDNTGYQNLPSNTVVEVLTCVPNTTPAPVPITTPAPTPANDILSPGQSLSLTQKRVSSQGSYSLVLGIDGHLQILDSSQNFVWGTKPFTGDTLEMGYDGVLRLLNNNQVVWSQTGDAGAYLQITSSGSAILIKNGYTYWTSQSSAGGKN